MSDSQERSQTPPREFIPVNNPSEAAYLLREGAKALSSALIWTRDNKRTLNTHLSVYSEAERVLYVWLPPDLDAKQLDSDLSGPDNRGECFFSVSLPGANVFFRTVYVGYDAGGLKFRFPAALFKVQRREHARLTIPAGYVLKAEFQDPVFPDRQLVKKVIDISSGGLAILVTEAERPLFHAEMTLHQLSFTLNGRKITCDAEVKHVASFSSEDRNKGVKVGLRFKALSKADLDWIASYVTDESRRLYSRFI